MSTSASYFNGSSTFSASLNNVIANAVAKANLPITQLTNEQTVDTGQQAELQTLGTDFTTLQTALGSIDSATSASLAATVDTPSVATATVGTGALAGSYAVDITNLGAQTNTISNSTLPTVADPSKGSISTSSTFTLTVGTTPFTLTPASNSLDSLVAAINTSGADVQATVVNVGGSAAPNYELSIQGTQYAATAIQLNDGSQDLLTSLTTGSPVTYTVNGQPSAGATSTTRALPVSTGLTVNALAVGTANVTVAQSGGSVENALAALVTSFNAAQSEITNNRGQNGGPLTGQSVVQSLTGALQSLTNYNSSSSGTVQNITDLGLSFTATGQLQFDATTFQAAASNSLNDVMSFLGSESAGTGFLGAASTAMTNITDPTAGVIVQDTNSLAATVKSLATKIATDQTALTLMQTNLTAQMAAADSAVAALQSQVSEVTDMFAAEQAQTTAESNG
jgi:flagellar hook-associated protein 2